MSYFFNDINICEKVERVKIKIITGSAKNSILGKGGSNSEQRNSNSEICSDGRDINPGEFGENGSFNGLASFEGRELTRRTSRRIVMISVVCKSSRARNLFIKYLIFFFERRKKKKKKKKRKKGKNQVKGSFYKVQQVNEQLL